MNNLQKRNRVQSIDLLRGLVMIVMALDHCRDYFHIGVGLDQDPLDLSTTTPFLFFTRWITNFCAPVFVFLSGTGIFLYGSKGKTKKEVALFLFTRGLWLIAVEIFIILPLWNFYFSLMYLQVIWAIGISMVILSVLQFLPYKILLLTGLAIVFGHNLLDPVTAGNQFSFKSLIWSLVHQQNSFIVNKNFMIAIQYPFLPWLGLMIVGYCTGKLYLTEVSSGYRRKILRMAGTLSIIGFIIIRWTNVYGDMHTWSVQKNPVYTLLDFIKVTKYPPSLLFMLITIGPALIFLSYAENIKNSVTEKIVVFGKTPFFYYILHVIVIHSLSWLTFFVTGHGWKDLDFDHFRDGSLPYGAGYPLWTVYAAWIAVIIILYFPCRWYSKYKETHKHWWLSYI